MRLTPLALGCLFALALAALPAVAAPLTAEAPRAAAPAVPAPPAGAGLPTLPALPGDPATVVETPAIPAVPAIPAIPAPAAAALETPVTPAAAVDVPAAKPVYPYTGYVAGDLVNVRCGPGLYYYPLVALNKDTPVIVEAEADGWLALRPADSVFGLINKKDLTLAADGKTATVASPSARVYAASGTAERQWCVMSTLKQGDAVAVVGPHDESYLRVAPPADARMYVVDKYVAAKSAGGVEPPTVAVNIEPPKVEPLVEDYKAADDLLRAEMAKPLGQRNYEEAAAKFKEIAEKADKAYLKQSAAKRVAHIAALVEQQNDFLEVTGLSKELDQKLADIKTQWAGKQVEAERDKRLQNPDFVATGLLAPMESLEGVDYPIKFKLVDQNNRPLVVLQSTAYELGKYVGKVIGVRGTKKYLKEWRIYLVTVDDLEVIE